MRRRPGAAADWAVLQERSSKDGLGWVMMSEAALIDKEMVRRRFGAQSDCAARPRSVHAPAASLTARLLARARRDPRARPDRQRHAQAPGRHWRAREHVGHRHRRPRPRLRRLRLGRHDLPPRGQRRPQEARRCRHLCVPCPRDAADLRRPELGPEQLPGHEPVSARQHDDRLRPAGLRLPGPGASFV